MIKKIILSTMLNFISKNYGSLEAEYPCYDMEKMAKDIAKALERKYELIEREKIDSYEL